MTRSNVPVNNERTANTLAGADYLVTGRTGLGRDCWIVVCGTLLNSAGVRRINA